MKKPTESNLYKSMYKAYEKNGAGAVYELANKYNLPYHYCKPCDAETPTLVKLDNICGVCGQTKTVATTNQSSTTITL